MAAADTLFESSKTWKEGKTIKGVKTYREKDPDDGAPWHCRVSVHKPEEATFEQLWAKLGAYLHLSCLPYPIRIRQGQGSE